jgi:hypothetical protein
MPPPPCHIPVAMYTFINVHILLEILQLVKVTKQ